MPGVHLGVLWGQRTLWVADGPWSGTSSAYLSGWREGQSTFGRGYGVVGKRSPESTVLPSTPPPDDRPPCSRLPHWLDQHAHPEPRTFRYLDLVRAVIQVPTVAGLLALVAQLHHANITARRDAYNRSVETSLLIEQHELANPNLACALLPRGPQWGLEVSALRAMRYIELNLDLHERLWQQHQDGIFGDEEWEPWHRWFWDGSFPAKWFRRCGRGTATSTRRTSSATSTRR